MTEAHYLTDILVLLAAAVMTAGAIVGPWGLGFIDQVEEIRYIAEFGVIFLLFIIGIELKPARLWAMRRMVFGLGTAQVMLTGLVIAGLALLFDQSLRTALIIGFGLALSSTAFGLQILNERGEMGTVHGRTAFSVLLLQDLAVVPLLTLVSLLAADTALLEWKPRSSSPSSSSSAGFSCHRSCGWSPPAGPRRCSPQRPCSQCWARRGLWRRWACRWRWVPSLPD
jgi:hypothetical protein